MARKYTPAKYKAAMLAQTKYLREAMQMTQDGMAAALDVKVATYKKYETRTMLPRDLVVRFCRVTGAKVRRFLEVGYSADRPFVDGQKQEIAVDSAPRRRRRS